MLTLFVFFFQMSDNMNVLTGHFFWYTFKSLALFALGYHWLILATIDLVDVKWEILSFKHISKFYIHFYVDHILKKI